MPGCPAQKAARCIPPAFFLFYSLTLLGYFLNQRETERTECDIDDAIRAEDDDETDDAPHDGAPPLLALTLVFRPFDELKHAPDEEDERRPSEKQDNRIDYLHYNFS